MKLTRIQAVSIKLNLVSGKFMNQINFGLIEFLDHRVLRIPLIHILWRYGKRSHDHILHISFFVFLYTQVFALKQRSQKNLCNDHKFFSPLFLVLKRCFEVFHGFVWRNTVEQYHGIIPLCGDVSLTILLSVTLNLSTTRHERSFL